MRERNPIMDRLPFHLFQKLPLTTRDVATLSRVNTTLAAMCTAWWCENGISLRQTAAHDVLSQPRWHALRKLRVWAHWFPEDHGLSWVSFTSPLSSLRELVLDRALHPLAPWADVLDQVPVLDTLDITTRLGATSHREVRALGDVIRSAAPRVTTLRVHCEGVVFYPKEMFQRHAVCAAVKTLYGIGVVESDTLRTYRNTGKQACSVPVNAPLTELCVEEGDAGPCALDRVGARCNETLRTLAITASSSRLPGGVRARFPNVTTTHITIEPVRATRFSEVSQWLAREIPSHTRTLTLDLDLYWFLPDIWMVWEETTFASLPYLETVTIVCSHAPMGTSGVLRVLHSASPTLRAVLFKTRWCAVDNYFGTIDVGDRTDDDANDIWHLQNEIKNIHRDVLGLLRARPGLDVQVDLARK